MRVMAILEADEETVKLLGYGEHEGEFMYPYASWDEAEIERIGTMILQSEERVAARILGDARAVMQRQGKSEAEIKASEALFRQKIEEEKERPLHERAVELLEQHFMTPRIRLDDGRGIVWGCEVWWAPEEHKDDVIGDRKVVLVDPPERPVDGTP